MMPVLGKLEVSTEMIAKPRQTCQFRKALCVVVVSLALLLPSGPAVAQSVKSCAHATSAATRGLDILENASGRESARDVAERSRFPLWRTIAVGTYKDVKTVRAALAAGPCPIHVGDWAGEILDRLAFPFGQAPATLELVLASVSALGFGEEGASLKDIYTRAPRLGLELGPAEVGPALRLGYLDQPLGEFLHVAMQPVARYGGQPVDFTIGNGGAGLLLLGGDAGSDLVLSGAVRFVFVRSNVLADHH
jgi:hypothetical protein